LTNPVLWYKKIYKDNLHKKVIILDFSINEDVFEATLKEKLGPDYDRGLVIFRKIDNDKKLDLIRILLQAEEKNVLPKIINELERLFKKEYFNKFDLEEANRAFEAIKKELEI